MPKVKCTRAWWHNRTYYKAGSLVTVPEGATIPAGFIVDGKPTPMKSGKSVKIQMGQSETEALRARVRELEAAQSEGSALKDRIAELEAAFAKLSQNSQPPVEKKSGKKE